MNGELVHEFFGGSVRVNIYVSEWMPISGKKFSPA